MALAPELNWQPEHPRIISYTVTHAIAGRVRLCVPRIAADPQYASRLAALVESAPGVTSARVNLAAASIAIGYRPGATSEQAMRTRLVGMVESAR